MQHEVSRPGFVEAPAPTPGNLYPTKTLLEPIAASLRVDLEGIVFADPTYGE